VVCGGCLDYKVVVALDAGSFAAWEAKKFEPEESFLAAGENNQEATGHSLGTQVLRTVLSMSTEYGHCEAAPHALATSVQMLLDSMPIARAYCSILDTFVCLHASQLRRFLESLWSRLRLTP